MAPSGYGAAAAPLTQQIFLLIFVWINGEGGIVMRWLRVGERCARQNKARQRAAFLLQQDKHIPTAAGCLDWDALTQNTVTDCSPCVQRGQHWSTLRKTMMIAAATITTTVLITVLKRVVL